MASIKLGFRLRLESEPVAHFKVHGPQFHRFLPDGQNDAVWLTPEGDPHEIRVWFDRRVKKRGQFLEWDRDGTEFDETTMRRQGRIEAGDLRGEMVVPNVSADELESLFRDPKAMNESSGRDMSDDPAYQHLGKRVLNRLHPPLANFIATLRDQYGQYWLQVPAAWDSRRSTLGAYCNSTLLVFWWDDRALDWRRFLPTNLGQTIHVQRLPGREYAEYLTEEDWRRLQRTRCLTEVSTELQLLGNANRALDFGDLRQAFIEVMSALELVIARRFTSPSKAVNSAINNFINGESQKTQVSVLLFAIGAPTAEIEAAQNAISVRNRVAHEGYLPTPAEASQLRTVIQTIKRLAGIEEIKSPVLEAGNMLSAPT